MKVLKTFPKPIGLEIATFVSQKLLRIIIKAKSYHFGFMTVLRIFPKLIGFKNCSLGSKITFKNWPLNHGLPDIHFATIRWSIVFWVVRKLQQIVIAVKIVAYRHIASEYLRKFNLETDLCNVGLLRELLLEYLQEIPRNSSGDSSWIPPRNPPRILPVAPSGITPGPSSGIPPGAP